MANSIYLGGGIKSAFCGGNVKEIHLGTNKLFPSEDKNVVVVGLNKYHFVQIGSLLWLTENLKEESLGGLWYANDKETYEPMKYGKLYKWSEICSANKTPSSNLSLILPEGWRVPTLDDFENLYTSAGGGSSGKNLKSTTQWKSGAGLDTFGMNVLPTGYNNGTSFKDRTSYAYWWSSESSGSSAYNYDFSYSWDYIARYTYSKSYYFSVRLCKDA